MLKIKNLGIKKDGTNILKNLDFRAGKSEFHVIMGPNGSGKSTLARTLAGHPEYVNYEGSIEYKNREISNLTPDERLKNGLMMGFQHPPRIKGVGIKGFLSKVLDKVDGDKTQDEKEEIMTSLTREFGFSEALLDRSINDGLSGGERKRLELLQARLVEPDLLILDEPDSGVDVDSLELISSQITQIHNRGATVILITHYGNLLKRLDLEDVRVHLARAGKIVTSGDKDLARAVEKKGFNQIFEECGCN